MVPPWVPPAGGPPGGPPPDPPESDDGQQGVPPHVAPPPPIAPAARFGSARLSLGKFASSGDRSALRRGVSEYVGKGYGGARTATRRLEGTARTAGALQNALATLAAETSPELATPGLDRTLLQGRSAREIIDAVIESARPVDGSQDAEASREAINDALSTLLERYPDADLLALTEEQQGLVIEEFTADDIFRRIELDVGNHIQAAAPTVAVALSRLREIQDYVREVVADSFRKLRAAGTSTRGANIADIVRAAIQTTMEVFELTRL